MNNNEYRSIAKFWYKDTHYQMFVNNDSRTSFLVINDKGEYEYPTLKQLLEVNTVINSVNPEMVQCIIRDNNNIRPPKKQKKVKFLPKVIIGGAAVLLTANMLGKIADNHNERDTRPRHNEVAIEQTTETNVDEEITQEEITNIVEHTDVTTNDFGDLADSYGTQNVEQNSLPKFEYDQSKYTYLLAAADDTNDFQYATDYRGYSRMTLVSDSSAYQDVLGFSKPTYSDIERAIDANSNINSEYKQALKTYVSDWLTMWPESDLSVFLINVKTLNIQECTPAEIAQLGLSSAAVACYQNSSNTIYVQEGINPNDRTSNDYIVLFHELTHVATTYKKDYNGEKIRIGTYSSENPVEAGIFYEEAVITNLIYQLRANNVNTDDKSIYYTVPCSYYRVIMDCVGYDGEDLMNHSLTYLVDKMGSYMDDREDSKEYAYYILTMIGYNYKLHSNTFVSVDVESFDPLYEYITNMYMKKYLKPGMSAEEAEEVFTNFTNEMSWNIENLTVEYDEQNADTFRPYFESYCEDLGISVGLSR